MISVPLRPVVPVSNMILASAQGSPLHRKSSYSPLHSSLHAGAGNVLCRVLAPVDKNAGCLSCYLCWCKVDLFNAGALT